MKIASTTTWVPLSVLLRWRCLCCSLWRWSASILFWLHICADAADAGVDKSSPRGRLCFFVKMCYNIHVGNVTPSLNHLIQTYWSKKMRDKKTTKTTGDTKKCRCHICPYGSKMKPNQDRDVWCGVAVEVEDGFDAGYVPARAGNYNDCLRYQRRATARLGQTAAA